MENEEKIYDPLLMDALKVIVEKNKVSIALIQRTLVVGYPRAARLVDQLEEKKYISYVEQGNWEILISKEEFEKLLKN